MEKLYNVSYKLKILESEYNDDYVKVLDSLIKVIVDNKINMKHIGDNSYASYINIDGVVGLKLVKYELKTQLTME